MMPEAASPLGDATFGLRKTTLPLDWHRRKPFKLGANVQGSEAQMADSPKVGSSVLVGVLAFIAATAWVAIEVIPDALNTPKRVFEPVPTQSRLIPASDSLAPNEALVTYAPPAPAPVAASTPVIENPQPAPSVPRQKVAAPAVKRAVAPSRPVETKPRAGTPIIVEARRLSPDERIQHLVMQRLAANARLDGQIAVESKDSVVRLSGWTRTAGQARLAEQDARSIQSVRQVRNEIRPRVGGSV